MKYTVRQLESQFEDYATCNGQSYRNGSIIVLTPKGHILNSKTAYKVERAEFSIERDGRRPILGVYLAKPVATNVPQKEDYINAYWKEHGVSDLEFETVCEQAGYNFNTCSCSGFYIRKEPVAIEIPFFEKKEVNHFESKVNAAARYLFSCN